MKPLTKPQQKLLNMTRRVAAPVVLRGNMFRVAFALERKGLGEVVVGDPLGNCRKMFKANDA